MSWGQSIVSSHCCFLTVRKAELLVRACVIFSPFPRHSMALNPLTLLLTCDVIALQCIGFAWSKSIGKYSYVHFLKSCSALALGG